MSIGSTLFVKYCEITRTYLVNRKNPTSHTAIGHGENINIHDSTGYAKKKSFLIASSMPRVISTRTGN